MRMCEYLYLTSPGESSACQMEFEPVASVGLLLAAYAGYEIHCCLVDCAMTRGPRYKMCFLGSRVEKKEKEEIMVFKVH